MNGIGDKKMNTTANKKQPLAIPRLERQNGFQTFMVNNEPFIMLGGEIHNSAGSSLNYMETEVWPNLRGLNMNTVIVPIYWECLEPQENQFDFHLVDGLIAQARQEELKLVFLWFGLWKNSESTYVPSWMKQDKKTYFPARKYNGDAINTISPLCQAAIDQDAKAFSKLMQHIKEVDEGIYTVLMVQIENEIGLLGTERDYGKLANEVFSQKIPAQVEVDFQVSGNWTEAFGEDAGEYFSAYFFAKAIEQIAKAGQAVYELPYYTNAWLEQFPWRAGSYPSGGPVMKMQKMWQLMASTIGFLAPDIYVPYAPKVMDEYAQRGNALFIPEIRKDAIAATYALYAAFGCHAIGFSPFGIEELQMAPEKIEKIPMEVLIALNIDPSAFDIEGSGKYLQKCYEMISQVYPLYLAHRGTSRLQAFIRKNSEELGTVLSFDQLDLQINYGRKERYQPDAGGVVIQISENEFYILGMKIHFKFLSKMGENTLIDIVSVEEGSIQDGMWQRERILNGDERMRIELKDMPRMIKVTVHAYI